MREHVEQALIAVLEHHLGEHALREADTGALVEGLESALRRHGWSDAPADLGSDDRLGVVVLSAGGEVRVPAAVRRDVTRHGVQVSSEPDLTNPDTLVVHATLGRPAAGAVESLSDSIGSRIRSAQRRLAVAAAAARDGAG